jgi:hypothetical protein
MATDRTIIHRDEAQVDADPHPGLVAEIERLVAEANAAGAAATDPDDDTCDAIMDKVLEIEARVAATPAHTLAGALALVRLAVGLIRGRVGPAPEYHDDAVVLAGLGSVEAILAALVEPGRSAPGEACH